MRSQPTILREKNLRMETKQVKRIEVATNAVMHGGPLPGIGTNSRLVELEQLYAAGLQQLDDVIQLARKHGSRGMRMDQGSALIATALYEVALRWGHDYERGMDWLSSIKEAYSQVVS